MLNSIGNTALVRCREVVRFSENPLSEARLYWGIFGGSNFRGFHGYYVIRPMKNCVQYRMGMIACAREHYTVNLITLRFFTVMYI